MIGIACNEQWRYWREPYEVNLELFEQQFCGSFDIFDPSSVCGKPESHHLPYVIDEVVACKQEHDIRKKGYSMVRQSADIGGKPESRDTARAQLEELVRQDMEQAVRHQLAAIGGRSEALHTVETDKGTKSR
jgi:hypothetical protein